MRKNEAISIVLAIATTACGGDVLELFTPIDRAPTDASNADVRDVPTSPSLCTTSDGKTCARAIGEACATDVDCCSGRCDAFACAPVGGCFPKCEPCVIDDDCCSHDCAIADDGVRRCQSPSRCVAEGDRCDPAALVGSIAACCSGACALDVASGGMRCQIPGAACRSDVSTCSLASECCGGFCVAGADGRLACRSRCSADSERCTTRGDCCTKGATCRRVGSALVCQ